MENYEILEHLNAGSFGKVAKIKRKQDNKVLVWKELHYGKMSEKEKQQLVAEVNILRELRHPNIVRYYDRIIDKQDQKIRIVQEYCEGGDISQLIKQCRKDREYIPEDIIWKFFMQIVLALHEIHRKKDGKILHRDIKPANIFLDGQSNVKLGDFGLSKVLPDENGFAFTHVGTPYYMSPEQITDKRYNEKSDIWALGCLLYEMAALHRPFEAQNHLSLALKIKSAKFDRIPTRYSDELQRVIVWMLTRDMSQRPSVDELLSIPQISMRLREKRLRETKATLKKKDDDFQKKKGDLEDLEIELKNREAEIAYKEQKMKEEEEKLKEREQNLYHATTNNNVFQPAPTLQRYSSLKKPPTSIDDADEDYHRLKMARQASMGDEPSTTRTNYSNISYDQGYYGATNTSTSSSGNPKLSRMPSRTEDSLVSENYLNHEINNILKNMDKIVAQTVNYGKNGSNGSGSNGSGSGGSKSSNEDMKENDDSPPTRSVDKNSMYNMPSQASSYGTQISSSKNTSGQKMLRKNSSKYLY